MTVAVLHNYYQHRGGEDAVFEAETALLEARGHRVVRFTKHNDDVRGRSPLALARATVWNPDTYRELSALLIRERPDVVHCHNTLPLLSPSVYAAACDAGIPVVQTLHNYRLLCANALLFRQGRVCEDCVGKVLPLSGVWHKCYRSSAAASAVVAGMTAWHRLTGTWQHSVHTYIVLTEFARQTFIRGGLPADKLVVKPNFVEQQTSPPTFNLHDRQRPYLLYVGRLSHEKGASTLIEAAKRLQREGFDDAELWIVGDGPLEESLRQSIADHALHAVHLMGRKSPSEVIQLLQGALCLVFPSTLYETFGKSMVEAFACGTPVMCSRLGAMQEVVEHGITGFHFNSGDADDLARTIRHCVGLAAQKPDEYLALRRTARQRYEERYTAEQNAQQLEQIYERALNNSVSSSQSC
jgi:glycosyltransferase involved in cell wall biosynthesis